MTDEPTQDALERELHRRFAESARGVDDTDAVLTAMRPRLARARRNRRLATGSAVVLGVALVAVVFVVAAFSGVDHDRRVNVPPASHAPVAPTTTGASAATGGAGATDTVPSADPGGKPEDNGTVPPPATTPANDAAPGAGPVGAPDATAATTVPPATDTTYSSPGGSIGVHRSGDTISLASSAPAAGFTPEVHDNGPTRVEVRFTNGGTEWRIRVDLVGGQLVAETTQHG
jgi:hypothetical protein